MARYNASNNWETELSSAIDSSQTSISVVGAAGHPTEPFKVSVGDEIMNVTVVSGTTLTVQRDQEGTTNSGHGLGTKVENRFTAEVQNDLWDEVDTHIDNTTDPHGAVSTATADKIMIRDGDGRARVAAPSHNDDIARKLEVDARVAKTGDTMSGELNMSDNLLTRPKIKDYGETAVIATGVNGAVTIDLENGNVVRHTLSGNVTYTFSNPPASGTAGSFTVIIEQPATAVTITWPTSVKWQDDAAPDDPGNSKVAIYTFITTDAGTRWYGFQAGTGFVI